jgi:hypothetical protein
VWGNSTVCQRVRVFRMFYEVREVVSPSVSLFFFLRPLLEKILDRSNILWLASESLLNPFEGLQFGHADRSNLDANTR